MSELVQQVPLWATERWLPRLDTRLDVVEELRESQAPLVAEFEEARRCLADVEARQAADVSAARQRALAKARGQKVRDTSVSALDHEAQLQVAAEREARAVIALVGWVEGAVDALTRSRKPEVRAFIERGHNFRTDDPEWIDACAVDAFLGRFKIGDGHPGSDPGVSSEVGKARRLRDAAEAVLEAGQVAA